MRTDSTRFPMTRVPKFRSLSNSSTDIFPGQRLVITGAWRRRRAMARLRPRNMPLSGLPPALRQRDSRASIDPQNADRAIGVAEGHVPTVGGEGQRMRLAGQAPGSEISSGLGIAKHHFRT